jgi:acetyl-CoA C-acetyltransferase
MHFNHWKGTMTGEPVAIINVGQTDYRSRSSRSIEDLIFRAVEDAIQGTPLDHADIDVVADAGSDVLDGRSLSDCTLIEPIGGHLKPSYRIEEDGAMALYYAYMLLRTGKYDTALAVGYGKNSNISRRQAGNMMFEPFYTRPLGLDGVTAAGLQANAYFESTGADIEDATRIVEENRAKGARNSKVGNELNKKSPGLDQASSPVARPLTETHCSPSTDGACAVLLARGPVARRTTSEPAWIKGASHYSDAYTLDRDLSRAPSCERAATEAYDEARIENPREELDVVEVTESFSVQELILLEELGLCDRGEAAGMVARGETAADGDIPVNMSGGALSADPKLATGLIRTAEVANQVTGDAGTRQIDGASLGVAHGTTGINLQNNAVFVIGA